MKRQKWFERKFELDLDDGKLNSVLERLAKTLVKIEELIKNLPEEILNRKPEGKWSIKENIGHLSDL